jgi:hypothetical protein
MIRLEHGRVLHPRSDVQQELAKLQRQRAWKGANYHCNACRFQGASGLQVIGGLECGFGELSSRGLGFNRPVRHCKWQMAQWSRALGAGLRR